MIVSEVTGRTFLKIEYAPPNLVNYFGISVQKLRQFNKVIIREKTKKLQNSPTFPVKF